MILYKEPVCNQIIAPLLTYVTYRAGNRIPEVIRLHIFQIVLICMRFPLVMLVEGIPMCICMFQYSESTRMLLLYYYPADMNHPKPQLYFPYLFILKPIICMIVLISSTTSVFIPTIFICITGIVGLYYI